MTLEEMRFKRCMLGAQALGILTVLAKYTKDGTVTMPDETIELIKQIDAEWDATFGPLEEVKP